MPDRANSLPSKLHRFLPTTNSRRLAWGAGLLAVAASGLLAHGGGSPDPALHTVGRGPVRGVVVARGSLEAARSTDVVCRVKSLSGGRPTTIRWVIDDGTPVRRGDLLVQLDDSELHERLTAQRIALEAARAAWVEAEKTLEIVLSQNKSDAASAALALELATLDLEKYTRGDYPRQVKDLEGRLSLARTDLAMWEERAAWSARMSRPDRRYVTETQARAEEASRKAARFALAKVEEELRVLTVYTAPRTVRMLTGRVDEARLRVERVRSQARAREIRDDRVRRARRRVYQRTLQRYHDTEQEIRKCRVVAPHDGLVVYEAPPSRAAAQQSILAQGEPVREGQRMMRLPDLGGLTVRALVHEASVGRVRGERQEPTGFCDCVRAGLTLGHPPLPCLGGQAAFVALRDELRDRFEDLEHRVVAGGQPAEITVEAFPGQTFAGEVQSVATVPTRLDPSSDADVNLYQVVVRAKEAPGGWRPGMSAAVRIFTETDRPDGLAVPTRAILGGPELGDRRQVLVWTEDGPEAREILVGRFDESLAEVVAGLAEGEQVVLNPAEVTAEP
jgi:HlyD family secretion protein